MSKEIYISSTPHETRLAIVESDALTEIYYERENEYTLAGSIYNGRVTRVLPGMQSSFVDIGLERDAFLYITDFMEEAGDSADFDGHAAPAEQQPRQLADGNRAEAGRGEMGRSEPRRDRGPRNDRSERGDRNERGGNREVREPRPEPTDADLFNEAMAGLDPVRSDAGNGGSSSRRGGRDRRPRNDRGERGGNREAGGAPETAAREQSYDAPEAHILTSPAPIETEDLGEGAPGADGSRRWRGRRGRRGNRVLAGSDRTANANTGSEANEALETQASRPATGPVYDSYPEPEASRLDLDASAPEPAAAAETSERGPRTNRGGRRGRNDRGRNRGNGERQSGGQTGAVPSEQMPQARTPQAPRIPRGFAPSASLYKVEGADDTHEAGTGETSSETEGQAYGLPYGQEPDLPASAEPMILPGESLSKYRPGGETAVSRAAEAAPAPISEFVVAGWDGGSVLPGETLRPRGPMAEGGSESRPASRERDSRDNRDSRGARDTRGQQDGGRRDARGGRDRNDRNDRNDRGGRSDRGSRNDPAARGPRSPEGAPFRNAAPQAAQAEPAEGIEPMERGGLDQRPEASAIHEPEARLEPVSTVGEPEQPTYLSDPDHIPPSHLVTPIRSTFVAPPPMPSEAPEPIALRASTESSVSGIGEAPAEYEPTEGSASFRVDPAAPSEYRQAAPVLEAEPEHEAATYHPLETAAFAEPSNQATEPAPEPVIAAASESDPADLHSVSPALHAAFAHTETHETSADQAGEPSFAEHEFTSISGTGEMHSEPPQVATEVAGTEAAAIQAPVPTQPAHFEPGSGMLEEEMLDDEAEADEQAPVDTMHGHAHSDAEQETLEGAADLASMLHDLSIDHITRSEPSVDDEDDGFEDFLEEDQLEEDELEEDQMDDQDEQVETSSDDDDDQDDDVSEEDESEPILLDQPGRSDYGSGFEGDHSRSATASAEARAGASSDAQRREPRRDRNDRSRRDGRRDGRDRNDRNDGRNRSAGGGRDRDRGFSSPGADRIVTDRDRTSSSSGRRDGRGGRNSMQATNLPAISDLLKPGQELLCQIAKEPIAKKGARITSHIALPGRFLVFMPTVSHTGVSRKIDSDHERRRLKEILLSERGEATGGFIVRTAAAGATEEELRSDLRFLLNLWADIKTRSESSKSPALIYHDLNLVERVLRDQVTDNFSAIWVDTESQYEQVLRFLQRFQPSLIRRVKLYTKETPLFEQFGITEEINKALRSKVWLKSGGSIVINQTEALVAIDINTGKYVGKTARLEDTIVKTNLDAIPEIVRQIRLRDLGGIIIIDFIDMDERKNRNKVLAALEEELKADRAPSKVLNFNDFGLIAITRKRVKQSLERTLSVTCGVCAGTGMTKSPVTVCNDIYVEMRKMHKHLDRGDVMLRVHPDVVKQLKAPATNWLHEMEEMCGKTILVKSDPSLHPEQFDIH